MAEFRLPVDIGNRACDHCGVSLIDTTLGFAAPTKQAQRIGAVYGKLRRAELQRNTWRFAIRRTVLRAIDAGTMIIAAALWDAATVYFVGSIVADDLGNLWISRIPNNVGYQPQNTPGWEAYFGPLTVSLYDAATTYYAGELVYTAPGDGTSRVYLSLQNANADDPGVATAYDVTAVYSKNQVVTYLSTAYMSLLDLNTGNLPTATPDPWSAGSTYAFGNTVIGSDGVVYSSLINGNVGIDPVLDVGTNWQNTGQLGAWTTGFIGGAGSIKWLQIGGSEFPSGVTLTTPNIIYPVGAGPSSQAATRNVFRLPSGFLRKVVQEPKGGSVSYLGSSSGRLYDDWTFENNYLVSQETGPIPFRFGADVTDVATMDDMFCEGLGARIGLEVCEPLTQSATKINVIAQAYAKFMGDARLMNSIEVGAEEPPEDDYISCRN